MSKPLISEWHDQFVRQAEWTEMVRNQLYRQANLLQAGRVLDVGCGTGVITNDLARRTRGEIIGLDINPDMLAFARRQTGRVRYQVGDAADLEFADGYFDVVTCHFTLMWVADPAEVVQEMARVTHKGGSVLICAEPDYGGRIDWPDLPLRDWQIQGLRSQGANPLIGRQVRQLMTQAGLRTEMGIIPSHWDAYMLYENFQAEWKWLQYDIGDQVDPAMLEQVKNWDYQAIQEGTRVLYIPIFYALGKK